MPRHRIATYNIAFAARKTCFLPNDRLRAEAMAALLVDMKVEAAAIQEAVRRRGDDGAFFVDRLLRRLRPGSMTSFQAAVAIGLHSVCPFNKLTHLREQGVDWQEQGPAMWIGCSEVESSLWLRNLACDVSLQAKVEASRPMPHPLYFGSEDAPAGRDDEDRPVLWARLSEMSEDGLAEEGATLVMACAHLPTLRGERQATPTSVFSERQREIMQATLGLSEAADVDTLGSALRCFCLRQILSQAERLITHWQERGRRCVVAICGDFNFEHLADPPVAERRLFLDSGYFPAKASGATRTKTDPGEPDRMIDNVWFKGIDSAAVQEIPPPHSPGEHEWAELSDHLPVVVEFEL